jgi:hypothetical protein
VCIVINLFVRLIIYILSGLRFQPLDAEAVPLALIPHLPHVVYLQAIPKPVDYVHATRWSVQPILGKLLPVLEEFVADSAIVQMGSLGPQTTVVGRVAEAESNVAETCSCSADTSAFSHVTCPVITSLNNYGLQSSAYGSPTSLIQCQYRLPDATGMYPSSGGLICRYNTLTGTSIVMSNRSCPLKLTSKHNCPLQR